MVQHGEPRPGDGCLDGLAHVTVPGIRVRHRQHSAYEIAAGDPLDFKFYVTYFLFDPGSGPKVVFWISHEDGQKVMQEAGLI
jgi:hypothetical protein